MVRKIPLIILFSAMITPGGVYSCEVGPNYKNPSIAERVGASTYIIEGLAKEITDKPVRENGKSALVQVTKWIKGKGPSQVIIHDFGLGPDCRSPIPSVKSVYFVNEIAPSEFELHYEGIFDAVIPATTSNISEISKKLDNH